jgi:hypothetical protein
VRRWWLFAAFAGLLVAFYTFAGLRGARLFPWYLVPLVPFFVLAAAAGLAALGGRRRWWLAALLVAWQLPAIDWRQPLLPAGHELIREQVLLDAGARLRQQLPHDAVIAAPEIGAVGYASNLPILDTVGLVSHAALPYYRLPGADNAIPPRLIEDHRPHAIVTLDAFARDALLSDAAFQRDYRLAWTSPAAVWRSQELLVFVRNAQ